MEDQKITKESLLRSKAKMIADRNERFALIEKEVLAFHKDVYQKITSLHTKIKSQSDNSQHQPKI